MCVWLVRGLIHCILPFRSWWYSVGDTSMKECQTLKSMLHAILKLNLRQNRGPCSIMGLLTLLEAAYLIPWKISKEFGSWIL